MVGGSRTLNDYSIRPKLTTATNYVTTINNINYNFFIYFSHSCIFSLMVKYRFSAPYDMGSNPIRCSKYIYYI